MPKLVFQYPSKFPLECGESLPSFQLTYHTYGSLNAQKDNVIWVMHALTANSDAADWWEGLFGEGRLLDPKKYFIICANMLGSCYGSTYALSENPLTGRPYFHDFPLLTNLDMVKAFDLLRESLGISQISLGLGGSMGGQQLLEWAIFRPEIFHQLAPIATNARHSPWGIAFNEAQRMAILADASWKEDRPDAGLDGMRAARATALLSYRSYETYGRTQEDPNPTNGQLEKYRASTYQQYQGEKLARRFDAFAYWTLSQAMDAHDLGRGRGSREAALATIQAQTTCISIHSDVLFPPVEQRFLADHIPNASYEIVESMYGHDGFLIETEALNRILGEKREVGGERVL
ncbi:MAG: homoserine O-acetyltransferase [Bacteroidota bacterium]